MPWKQRLDAYFSTDDAREGLVAAVSRLVAVKSVKGPASPGAPFGPGPARALEEALAVCKQLGFAAHSYDGYVGVAELGKGPVQLHILGHLDVVDEGSGWHTDPYTCVEKDGMLYGRGVSDDKGPVCAALYAMKALKDLGVPLSKSVRLIMGTDEESGSADIAYYYAREPYAPQSFTPDADFPLINVEKGQYYPDFGRSWAPESATPRVCSLQGGLRQNVVPPQAQAHLAGLEAGQVEPFLPEAERATGARFRLSREEGGVCLHCMGRNAHAASPDDGINALAALLEVLAKLPLAECESTRAVRAMHALFPFGDNRGRALGIAQADAESGPLTVNLALMTLTETGFTAKFDARVPACATEENCRRVCEEALARYGIVVTADGDMTPVHRVGSDSPLVGTLLSCYETFTGQAGAKPLSIGGGTYVHDIPGGVAFGCVFPGFEPRMHAADERCRVDDLIRSAKIFALAIARLCA